MGLAGWKRCCHDLRQKKNSSKNIKVADALWHVTPFRSMSEGYSSRFSFMRC